MGSFPQTYIDPIFIYNILIAINLCNFHDFIFYDLHISVTFVMYFEGQNKDILFIYKIIKNVLFNARTKFCLYDL